MGVKPGKKNSGICFCFPFSHPPYCHSRPSSPSSPLFVPLFSIRSRNFLFTARYRERWIPKDTRYHPNRRQQFATVAASKTVSTLSSSFIHGIRNRAEQRLPSVSTGKDSISRSGWMQISSRAEEQFD